MGPICRQCGIRTDLSGHGGLRRLSYFNRKEIDGTQVRRVDPLTAAPNRIGICTARGFDSVFLAADATQLKTSGLHRSCRRTAGATIRFDDLLLRTEHFQIRE